MQTKFAQNIKKRLAFTLVELVIVIAIISLLAAVVVVAINPNAMFTNARNAQRASDVTTIKDAISRYIADSPTTSSRFFSDFSGYSNLSITNNAVASLYSPVAYWHLDGSGNIANGNTSADSSGNNITLTASNLNGSGMSYSTGTVNSSSNFDGVDDYFTTPDNDLMDIRTTSKSWSMWFKTSSTSVGRLIRKSDGSNANGVIINISSLGGIGRIDCTIGQTPQIVANPVNTYNDGLWHHLACVLDRVQNKLLVYIDGVLTTSPDSSALGATDLNASATFTVASQNGGSINFQGLMDEVFITNTALSLAQVQNIYNNTGEGICIGGSSGNNLNFTGRGIDITLNTASTLNLSTLVNLGYLPKVPSDPTAGNYKSCLDINNNKLVIFAPSTESGVAIKYAAI